MGEQGYKRCSSDHCVFIQRFSGDDYIILLLYVDDILIAGKNVSRIARLKKELSKSFAMKDLGLAKCILGMRIERDRKSNKLYLSQEKYIEKTLRKFKIDKARKVSCPLAAHFKLSKKQCPFTEKMEKEMQNVPYASAVGSLMYAMVCTRPDIAQVVSTVSRFMSNPGGPLMRVNSTNVQDEGLKIGGIGRQMNSKVKVNQTRRVLRINMVVNLA
jgi:ATP-binding cassette subfamily B (MDR/TAP) protein 1